ACAGMSAGPSRRVIVVWRHRDRRRDRHSIRWRSFGRVSVDLLWIAANWRAGSSHKLDDAGFDSRDENESDASSRVIHQKESVVRPIDCLAGFNREFSTPTAVGSPFADDEPSGDLFINGCAVNRANASRESSLFHSGPLEEIACFG